MDVSEFGSHGVDIVVATDSLLISSLMEVKCSDLETGRTWMWVSAGAAAGGWWLWSGFSPPGSGSHSASGDTGTLVWRIRIFLGKGSGSGNTNKWHKYDIIKIISLFFRNLLVLFNI